MIRRVSDTPNFPKSKYNISPILAQLDELYSHLSDTILPKQPYLLSVPSDVPYRHSSRFVNTWYEGTPFDRKEEQLQYVSFLPHLGEHESLLKVEGGWADDDGNPIEEEELSPKAVPASGRATPAETGQRKKISLKDYKTKGKSPPVSTIQASPAQAIKEAETNSTNPKTVAEETATAPTEKKQRGPASPSKGTKDQQPQPPKRLPVDGAGSPQTPPAKSLQTSAPSPAKRRKLSPAPEEQIHPSKAPMAESQTSVMKMPRLLSPTLPSPQKEKDYSLPELLSPILPPSLAKAISTPPNTASIGSPASTPHQRSDPVRSILARADLDNDPPSDKNALSLSGSRVRSDSQHSARSSAPGTPNAAKVGLGAKALSKPGLKPGTPLHNGVRVSPGPRQRHTIILKYGKKNRKRVEALLKFAPRPKKDANKQERVGSRMSPEAPSGKKAAKEEHMEGHHVHDSKPKANTVDNIKLEKKRKAEDSPSPSMKKIKASENEKRPTTPVPSAGKTPLMSHSRSTFSTPKKELKATAMRRVESSDGVDAPTPSADKARVSTPVAVAKPSPQATSSSTTREEEKQQWGSLNSKFFALGRSLKHEGTSLLPSSENEGKPGQHARAVVSLIEALICFMINICAQSHARPGADPGWRSIILYHIFVFRASRKFPHLHGLVVQLGAICRQLIHKFDMDRLARDPLPDDYFNSAPTPGSDGNTKTTEDAEKYKKRYVEFKDELIHNARELQTAWLDGSRHLSPDLLRREYPITWAKRSKDSSARLQEKVSPSKISQDFYLPMDANTTAFEAARFGVAFLQEWTDKEKVEWKTRIDL